jgi:hypothetical protein
LKEVRENVQGAVKADSAQAVPFHDIREEDPNWRKKKIRQRIRQENPEAVLDETIEYTLDGNTLFLVPSCDGVMKAEMFAPAERTTLRKHQKESVTVGQAMKVDLGPLRTFGNVRAEVTLIPRDGTEEVKRTIMLPAS